MWSGRGTYPEWTEPERATLGVAAGRTDGKIICMVRISVSFMRTIVDYMGRLLAVRTQFVSYIESFVKVDAN